MAVDVQKLIKRNDQLKQRRGTWDNHYQVLGEYISQVKQSFEVIQPVGEFLSEDVFDSTGTFAAHSAASALLGILWPANSRKSVKIEPPEDMENPSGDEIRWYEEVTKRLTRSMDRPEANLQLALDEYMLDQQIFGTSGIGVFWEDDTLLYKPFGVREMFIDEGKNGRVNTVYLNFEWDLNRVVDEYGIDNVSPRLREKFENGKHEEQIKILIAYQPRDAIAPGGMGNLNMPVAAFHIEVASKHMLKESGFEEFPVQVSRFRKLSYEIYGRSPGMNALPDVREANALREAIIVATEKELDPPLGLLNDGMLGGGVVDTSAGALNVFDVQANVGNSPPIFPINTVGDMNTALARIEALEQSIGQHFSIDRLLDFNNETEMTATETAARSSIRNASLASLISRQIIELFTPLIERSFNLMLRHDQLGFIEGTAEFELASQFEEEVLVIPERIAERLFDGRDAYNIRFTTPADRISSAEELEGMIQVLQLNQQLMQTHPETGAYLDIEKVQENAIRLFGAPPDIIHTPDEVEEIQQEQAQQAAQAQALEQAQQASQVIKNVEGMQ